MRDLKRNQQKIYYALQTGSEKILNDDGFETGESEITYGTPTELWISVSTARGEVQERAFGKSLEYDRVMSTANKSLPITETTVLWIDETDTTKAHDYIVKKVAFSINGAVYAIKKVR